MRETHLRGRGLVGGAAVVVLCVAILLVGLVAGAGAIPWQANGTEPSAGEQLGLKPREAQTGESLQLTQTAAVSPGGDEFFGFDNETGVGAVLWRSSAGSGYLGFRRQGSALRLLGRFPALATPPVIGGGREALVTFTLNCKQHSILPFGGWLERLQLLTGALGRRPTTTTVLSSTAEANRTRIAASPSGDLAVAWLTPDRRFGINIPEPTDLLHLSVGHASESTGRPVVFGVDGVWLRERNPFFTDVQLAWTAPAQITALRAAIGAERLAAYDATAGHDQARAVDLYGWNAAISAALFEDFSVLEVVLRNACHRELQAWNLAQGNTSPWYYHPVLTPGGMQDVGRARQRIARNHPRGAASSYWLILIERSPATQGACGRRNAFCVLPL